MPAVLLWLGETAIGAILKALFARWLAPKAAPCPQLTTVQAAETELHQVSDKQVADAIQKDGL